MREELRTRLRKRGEVDGVLSRRFRDLLGLREGLRRIKVRVGPLQRSGDQLRLKGIAV